MCYGPLRFFHLAGDQQLQALLFYFGKDPDNLFITKVLQNMASSLGFIEMLPLLRALVAKWFAHLAYKSKCTLLIER